MSRGIKISRLLLVLFGILSLERAHSQGTAVTGINGSYTSATQFNYTSPGFIPTSDFPSSSSYNVVFGTAGTVNNDFVLDSTASFIAGSSFDLVQKADELRVRRNLVSSIGNKEVIGVEHLTLPSTTNGATVEIRNSRLKSLALEMNSLQLNLSGDQTFVNNTTGLSWSNVERLDYLFHAGLQTSTPNNSGFGVFERGGNDGFKIAAILALDLSGDPSILGPILMISSGSFGPALRPLDQTIMVKEDADVNYRPAQNLTGQSVHGIYISFDDLGIAADQLFYGYALLGTDVTANSINWNDNSVYPNSTGPSVGIDLCPGGGVFSSDGGLIASSVDSDGDGYADDVDIDDDNDGLRDVTECPDMGKPRIYNDDFEEIDIVTSGLDGGPSDVVSTAGIWKGDASNIPNWESSDVVNNHLEIWHHSQAASDDAGGTPYSGAQWAEINATTNDGIYQDIPTTPGDTIQWGFAHRKRTGYAGSPIEDEVELLIGPSAGPLLSQGTFSSAGDASWTYHSGTYTVPVGQTTTRLSFTEISTASGSASSGNFVDRVEFFVRPQCPDTDLDGVSDHLDLDSDNDGLFDVLEAGGSDLDLDGIIGSSPIIDTDGDGWSDLTDPDDGGTVLSDLDTDGDGAENRIDLDSDGDTCHDVIEAGFPDSDGDGELGGLVPPSVNSNGKVTSGGL